jgi:ATP-dependent DNA ligase
VTDLGDDRLQNVARELGGQMDRGTRRDSACPQGVRAGEVVAVDETGRPRFHDLLRNTRLPAYVAFALLWLNGADLRSLPLTERRRRLQGILPKGWAIISEALSVTDTGHKLFELMCANDLEDIVAKRLTDSYNPRARRLKIKNPGYSQNEGRRELFDKSPRRSAAWQ